MTAISKRILKMRRPAPRPDSNNIKPHGKKMRIRLFGKPKISGVFDALFALVGYRIDRFGNGFAGLHFHDNNQVAFFGNEINFTHFGFITQCNDSISFYHQTCSGKPFCPIAPSIGTLPFISPWHL